jgi:hypothetical protein
MSDFAKPYYRIGHCFTKSPSKEIFCSHPNPKHWGSGLRLCSIVNRILVTTFKDRLNLVTQLWILYYCACIFINFLWFCYLILWIGCTRSPLTLSSKRRTRVASTCRSVTQVGTGTYLFEQTIRYYRRLKGTETRDKIWLNVIWMDRPELVLLPDLFYS